jgi:hypothetical protein
MSSTTLSRRDKTDLVYRKTANSGIFLGGFIAGGALVGALSLGLITFAVATLIVAVLLTIRVATSFRS